MDQAINIYPPGRPVIPDWPRARLVRLARAWVQAPLFALLDRVAPAQVTGRHWLADLDGPAIFVANHASHLDTPVLLHALPETWRARVAVAAAADYFAPGSWRGVGAALLFNTFPVSRTAARQTLAAVRRSAGRGLVAADLSGRDAHPDRGDGDVSWRRGAAGGALRGAGGAGLPGRAVRRLAQRAARAAPRPGAGALRPTAALRPRHPARRSRRQLWRARSGTWRRG